MSYNTSVDSLTSPKLSAYLEDMEELKNGSSSQNGCYKRSPKMEFEREIGEIEIPVPWGHISAKTYGSPSGHPVLAVHGWMDNAGTFDRIVPLLCKEFYIVAVDMPGHGLSSHIPLGMPYHFADFIISLRRVVTYMKWTKFSWLGHSMGAGLGAIYAATYPSEVQHLIMLDLTKPLTSETGSDYAAKIATAVDHFLALEQKIQPIPPTHTYDDALGRMKKSMWGTLSEESAKCLMVRGARQVGEDQWCFVRDLRLRSPSILRLSEEQCSNILSKIRAATMIIKASDAPWFEPREVCENAMNIYRKNCPVFNLVTVEGNHFVHLDAPERCAEHINRFITEYNKVNL